MPLSGDSLKIAHVLHPYVPNRGYQENHLPREQRELGHDAQIFTSNTIPEKFGGHSFEKDTVVNYAGVPTHRLDTLFDIDSMGQAWLSGLGSALLTFDPDVIHSHGVHSLPTIQSLMHNLKTGTDLYVDVHVDNDNLHLDSFLKSSLFMSHKYCLVPILKSRVKGFIAVNPYAEQFLSREYGISPAEIDNLPLGVDTSMFHNRDDGGRVRTQYEIDSMTTLIITVGNLDNTKDVGVLIRAFYDLVSDYSNSHLLIVGTGPSNYVDSLNGLVEELGLGSKVTFTGYVSHSDLKYYYNAADIGVWPGKLGISMIEALSTGLPLVVADSSATGHLVQNDNGFTFRRGSPHGLATVLKNYINNICLVDKHGKNSRALAIEKYDWRRIAESSIEIYL